MPDIETNHASAIRRTPLMVGVVVSSLVFATVLVVLAFRHEDARTAIGASVSSVEEPVTARGDHSTVQIQDLQDLISFRYSFSRSVALDNTLIEADFREVLNLLEQSSRIRSRMLRQSTQSAMFQRLAALDPARAFSHARSFPGNESEYFVLVVFREWSLSDTEQAVAYGEEAVHGESLTKSEKETILSTILHARSDLPGHEKREIGKRLGLESEAIALIDQFEKFALFENPSRAWNVLLDDDVDDFDQISQFVELALIQTEDHGLEVLFKLRDSISDRRTRTTVLRQVLSEKMTTHSPQSVFETTVNLVDDTNRSIIFDVASRWLSIDPVSLLSAIGQMTDGELREDLVTEVIYTWAVRDPRQLLQQLDAVPENLRELATNQAVFRLAGESPREASKYISKITSNRNGVLSTLLQKWVYLDSVEALEWLLNDPQLGADREPLFYIFMRTGITSANAKSLVELALEHPPNESGLGLEGRIVGMLASIDIEKAKELLPRVREGPGRLKAHVEIGASYLFARGEPEESIAYGEQLPSSDRDEYYGMLFEKWAIQRPEEAIGMIDQLPTIEAKAGVARQLVEMTSWLDVLSNEQIEELKSHLTVSENELIN